MNLHAGRYKRPRPVSQGSCSVRTAHMLCGFFTCASMHVECDARCRAAPAWRSIPFMTLVFSRWIRLDMGDVHVTKNRLIPPCG